jgi:hypothetical protein
MRCATVCLFVSALCGLLPGQVRTGAITGAVTDPDKGPVPLAAVQATSPSTGLTYKAVSAANGAYTLAALPAGVYDITIPSIGFTFPKFERKGVEVQAGQTVQLDLRLAWGGNLGTPGDDISSWVRNKGRPNGPAPRTRDGKPDFSGVWVGNPAESEDAALLPWADRIVKERRARDGAGNPGEACLPGDVLLVSPFLYKVIQTPSVMAVLWEGNVPGVMQIFLDGQNHPEKPYPSWMGHSVGRWDGDTLVVDTVGFNDSSWIRLYPHTEMLHVVQRYRRPDLGHIEKELTIEDPGTFLKPWKMHTSWDLAPSEEIQEYICNESEKDVSHMKRDPASH